MLFCKNCNNLYFITTDLKSNEIYLHCGYCNTKKSYDPLEDGEIRFNNNNTKRINIECLPTQFDKDCSLPRKILYCNGKCKAKKKHVCIKYDQQELKYMFKCLECNLLWKNKD